MPDAAPLRLEAPWDRGHVLITVLVTTLCLAGALLTGWAVLEAPDTVRRALAGAAFCVCAGTPLLAWLLAPVAFTVEPGRLTVHRRLWPLRFEGVTGARPVDPYLVAGALRVLGSGGVFGRYGRFQHVVLGRFTLYARRREGTVALATAKGTVVVAPSDPEAAVRIVGERRSEAA